MLLSEQGSWFTHPPCNVALATAQKQWPSVSWSISCSPTTFEDYTKSLNLEKFIKGLVGDTYRIWHYPSIGYQVEQLMPVRVRKSLRRLIEMGMTNPFPGGFCKDEL